MQRISLVGNSGSGKSTLGRRLAGALGLPYLELDSVFHQPGWTPAPTQEFRARVAAVAEGPAWVIDGNYTLVREDLVWPRADTVIWLDPPRRQVMGQVTRRTLRRMLLRQELWNGNRESWRNLFTRDPDRSIVMWAWSNHSTYHDRYRAAADDPRWAHLDFIRITSRDEADQLLRRGPAGRVRP